MVAQQNESFFAALDALLVSWQRISEFIDYHAAQLISMYTAYATDSYSYTEMQNQLTAFIPSHTEEFHELCATLLDNSIDHFLREIGRNLLSKHVTVNRRRHGTILLGEKISFRCCQTLLVMSPSLTSGSSGPSACGLKLL